MLSLTLLGHKQQEVTSVELDIKQGKNTVNWVKIWFGLVWLLFKPCYFFIEQDKTSVSYGEDLSSLEKNRKFE